VVPSLDADENLQHRTTEETSGVDESQLGGPEEGREVIIRSLVVG
jgi:hypothetical protein